MAVNKDFVVKNGLEVNRLLIRTNTSTNRVGINTDIINATFEVNGSILSKSLSVVGVTTFSTVNVTNSLQLSGSAGANGQYLRSTGTGVTWANFPSTRTSQTFTAITGQTLFPFSYTIGLLDVFLNGTKLSSSDFNASDGNNIVLNVPCIGGETVEVIGYSATTIGITTTIGISGITIREEGSVVGNVGSINAIDFVGAAVTAVGSGNSVTVYVSGSTGGSSSQWITTAAGIHTVSNVGIGTTIPTSALTVNGDVLITGVTTTQNLIANTGTFTGIVTALDLYGRDLILSSNVNATSLFAADGNLSGVVTASSFVGDGSALTGIVTSISAGPGISISQSVGIVTITGNEAHWEQTLAGIHTTSNVGIGITDPRFALEIGPIGASGTSLYVNGDARITGILTVGTSSIVIDGDSNTLTVPNLIVTNSTTGVIASGVGITIRDGGGDLGSAEIIDFGDNLSVSYSSGIATITGSAGGVSSQWITTATGIHTLSNVGVGTTNPTSALTVRGNVIVSGISTLSSNVSIGGTVSVDGGVKLTTNNATIVGTSGTAGEIKRIGGAPFFYDGSAWREFVLSSGTPVSVPADTEWDNVILRNTFDTDFTDSKFNVSPVAIGTGSTISASPLKFGTGAFRSDGTGIGVSYSYRPEYDFTGAWTIEFWMYVDNLQFGGGQGTLLVSSNSGINTNANWGFGIYKNFNADPYFVWVNQNHPTYDSGVGLDFYSSSQFNSIFDNKWVHIALVRESDNGSIHLYVDGVESDNTHQDQIIDNNILNVSGTGLQITGGPNLIGTENFDYTFDGSIDDLRITTDQRYTSVGITTTTTFTPPTTALPTTGTLSSYIQPPGDKYGEIGLGTSPTWRGTSGVTVTQQSSGNYRVSFASTYTNSNDYFVLTQAMDQGFASYVGVARSTTHVDFAINRQSNDAAVDTGSLSVQIKNHI